jgi:SAM-dependent methyltransferase
MKQQFEYRGRELEAMSFAENYHRLVLGIFEPYLGDRVVEVGAGDGAVTSLIAERAGRAITAIEPSERLFALLSSRVAGNRKINPLHGFLADVSGALPRGGPDSFLYINIYEHIEDDVTEMELVYRLLHAGGHLCIFVPALPRLYSDFDRRVDHYRRYTLPGLKQKCRSAGFSIQYARYFDFLGIFPWWLRFRLFKAKNLSPRAVRLYDRLGVPIIRLEESLIRPPLGKNVILVARKDET